MSEENINNPVVCEVSSFRCLAKINGIPLMDGTYLEQLITYLAKKKNLIPFEGIVDLKDLLSTFSMKSARGIRAVLKRLYNYGALILYQKVGKHHQYKYAISINANYAQFFFKEI